jgi:hypothetical protein
MLVSEVSTITSWADNVRNMITRRTFKYEDSNDVTIVTIKSEKFELYSDQGKESSFQKEKGNSVDVRA